MIVARRKKCYNYYMPTYNEEDEEILLTLQDNTEDFDFFDNAAKIEKKIESESKTEQECNPEPTVKTEDAEDNALANDALTETKEVSDDNPLLDDDLYDGQLSVDVIDNDEEIMIISAIAGVRLEDIDVTINHDMVTIKGMRRKASEIEEDRYLYQECYWGGFSRSIILPEDVDADSATATLENGILTIRLPKTHKNRVKRLKVEEKE